MTTQTDEDGRAKEESELEEEETDLTNEEDSEDSETLTLEDDDESLASIFDDEETTEEDSDDSGDKGSIPYDRFQKKVKMVGQWKDRALVAETELKTFKEVTENGPNPLQHYVDSGAEDPITQSQRDKVLVDALAALANSGDITDRRVVEKVIQTAQQKGANVTMNKQNTQVEEKEDSRVTEMLSDNVRTKTEALVKDWSPLTRKVVLREVANHVDFDQKVTKDSIVKAIKKVTKEYGFTKADIFTGPDKKKSKKAKPPTAGKGGSVDKATDADTQKKDELPKMTKNQFSQHLKSRLENFIEQEETAENE